MHRSIHRRAATALVVGLTSIVFTCDVASAQLSARFVQPPRALTQLLGEATEAIDDERYSDAIVLLGDLMERKVSDEDDPTLQSQDYFLEIEEDETQHLNQTVQQKCRTMIGNLPTKGWETYQLQFGALAEKLFQEASEQRDWERLKAVRRKYFHTEAGYKASFLLAQNELLLGRAISASILLDDVTVHPRAARICGPELKLLHAAACYMADRKLPAEIANQPLKLTGGETIDDVRGWVRANYSKSLVANPHTKNNLLTGSTTERNGNGAGETPLPSEKWSTITATSPQQDKKIDELEADILRQHQLLPPSWLPLQIGDLVLYRNTDKIWGMEYATGRRIWPYPPWQEEQETTPNQSGNVVFGRTTVRSTSPADQWKMRVWNDMPHGQMTSDGKAVFLIEDLDAVLPPPPSRIIGIRPMRVTGQSGNTLTAVELKSEGKLLWQIGSSPTIDSPLNGALFLSAPIVVEGSLYTVVEIAGDITLVCLNPATGELNWLQQLAAVEGAPFLSDQERRVSGATLSYSEGVLVCPTGAGATIGVNLIDRTLRWGNAYPRRAVSLTNRPFTVRQSIPDNSHDRWINWGPIIDQQNVILTPAISDSLLCLDLLTGKTRFTKSRDGLFYAAGIRDGQLLAVGADRVNCYDIQDGSFLWRTDQDLAPGDQQVVGRGVFGQDTYFLPLSGNTLAHVSLEDGSVVKRQKTQYPLGNLVAVQGSLLSQDANRIVRAQGKESLREAVEFLLQQNPDDVASLTDKAQVLLDDGDMVEALKLLDRARELDPSNADVLDTSIKAYLSLLRTSKNPSAKLLQELDALIDMPDDRREFIAMRLRSALDSDEISTATKMIIELSDSASAFNLPRDQGLPKTLTAEETSQRDLSFDAWLAGKAAEIEAKAEASGKSSEVKELIDGHLNSTETQELTTIDQLETLARQFAPFHPEELKTSLAKRLLANQSAFGAERALMGQTRADQWLNTPQPIGTETQLELLSKIYKDAGMSPDADYLKSVMDGEEGPPAVPSQVVTRGSSQPLDINQPVTARFVNRIRNIPGQNSLRATAPSIQGGNSYRGWVITNDYLGTRLQDPLGTTLSIPAPPRPSGSSSQSNCVGIFSGGAFLLQRAGKLSMLDMTTIATQRRSDMLRWSQDFAKETGGSITRRSRATVFGDAQPRYFGTTGSTSQSEFRVGPILGDRVIVLNNSTLSAIDVMTGDRIWARSGVPGTGQMIAKDDLVALVTPSQYGNNLTDGTVNVYSISDGRLVDTRPWKHGEVWSANGNHVLAYQQETGASVATVRLVEPMTDKVVQEIEAPVAQPVNDEGTRGFGRVIQDRFMVLYDNSGRLVIWDIIGGKELCRHETEALPDLGFLHVLWMQGQLLVVPAEEQQPSETGDGYLVQNATTHQPARRIYAISTTDGSMNWEKTFDQAWGITIVQPYASPVILLTRMLRKYTVTDVDKFIDVTMLSVSDGKELYLKEGHKVSKTTNGFETTQLVRPAQRQIIAKIGGESVTFTFGEPTKSASAQR